MKPLSDYRRIKRAQETAQRRKYEFLRSEEFLRLAAESLRQNQRPDKVGHAWYGKIK